MLLVAAIMIGGFGDSGSGGKTTAGGPLQLEAGADVATVENGAAISDGSAFLASDLPLDAGQQLLYAVNAPGTTVSINFDLEGPWRFTNGLGQSSFVVRTAAKDGAPNQDQFPDASVVSISSPSKSAAASEYIFESKDDRAWSSYGRVTATGTTVLYTAPSKALVFPMSVGDSWTDGYSEISDGQTTQITAENTVVANNQLIVPAGTFNAWLLQTKVSATSNAGSTVTIDYSWFVPGVGRAAEIVSQPDERQMPFSKARAFYTLKSYQ